MTQKFLRNFRLEIDLSADKTIVIAPPMQISFSCSKGFGGSLNQLTLKVKNLNSSDRLALVKDRADGTKVIPVRLFAGYANDIKLITSCTIFECNNARAGAEIETNITAVDGGHDLQTSNTSASVRSKEQSIKTLGSNLKRIKTGEVAVQDEVFRPIVLVGNTIQLARNSIQADEDFFIDNEQYFILKKSKFRKGQVPIVSSSTGLLNTPKKSSNIIIFTTLLDPTLKLGGAVNLESTLSAGLNGTYKVMSINYSCDYEGAAWQQEVTVTGVKNE